MGYLLSIGWKQVTSLLILILSLWPIIWEIVVFSRKPPRYFPMSRYPLFKLPWYYWTFPRYYHMCRYPPCYTSRYYHMCRYLLFLASVVTNPLYGIMLN